MASVAYADEIVVIDSPGHIEVPPHLLPKVTYVGSIQRSFSYQRSDKERARRELGLKHKNGFLISVFPGSWPEEQAPIWDLVLSAFRRLSEPKELFWIAGQDYERLVPKVPRDLSVHIRRQDWEIDRLMVASDVAITKANRKTVLELESLGVPTLSLSNGINPIDDKRIAAVLTNATLNAASTSPDQLAAALVDAAQHFFPPQNPPDTGAHFSAEDRIVHHLDTVRQSRTFASRLAKIVRRRLSLIS